MASLPTIIIITSFEWFYQYIYHQCQFSEIPWFIEIYPKSREISVKAAFFLILIDITSVLTKLIAINVIVPLNVSTQIEHWTTKNFNTKREGKYHVWKQFFRARKRMRKRRKKKQKKSPIHQLDNYYYHVVLYSKGFSTWSIWQWQAFALNSAFYPNSIQCTLHCTQAFRLIQADIVGLNKTQCTQIARVYLHESCV